MGHRHRHCVLVAVFCAAAAGTPSSLLAQDEPPPEGGEMGLGEEVFVEPESEAHAEPPELPESDETEGRLERDPHADDVIWTLGGGGTLSYGNARTAGVNVSTSIGLRSGPDVGVIEGSFLYAVAQSPLSCGAVQANPTSFPAGTVMFCGPSGTGMNPRARAPGFNDWAETAVNLNWRLRWDHFFDPSNAFFLAHRGRVDRFAGIRPRVGLNLGYSRVLFEERNHMMAIDLGVDATIDIYPDPIRAQTNAIVAGGGTLPVLSGTDARFVPSVRLGIAYVNHLNPYLTYDTNFEALWDVANPDHVRIEWVNHLRSAIDRTFQIRLDVTFRLDALPPGQAKSWVEDATTQTTTMFDVLTTLNLVGSFDLDGEPTMYASRQEPAPAAHQEPAPAAHQEPAPAAHQEPAPAAHQEPAPAAAASQAGTPTAETVAPLSEPATLEASSVPPDSAPESAR
jgi:hypothetical protein